MDTQVVKAPSRKEAILKTRSNNHPIILTSISAKVFSLVQDEVEYLVIVTDVVVGRYDENIFKVEIFLMPV